MVAGVLSPRGENPNAPLFIEDFPVLLELPSKDHSAVLKGLQEHDDTPAFAGVVSLVSKKTEERSVVFGRHRVYVLKKHKIEAAYHYAELVSLGSHSLAELKLGFEGPVGGHKTTTTNVVFKTKTADEVSDMIQCAREGYERCWPGSGKLVTDVTPAARLAEFEMDVGPAGGFTGSYRSLCDYYGCQFRAQFAHYIDNVVSVRGATDLRVRDISTVLVLLDYKAICGALLSNKYFDALIVNNCKLDKESVAVFAHLLKENTHLSEFHAAKCGLNKDAAHVLGDAILANPNSQIDTLVFAKNSIDDKGLTALSNVVAKAKKGFVHLDVSWVGGGQKGMSALFTALKSNSLHAASLSRLEISGNRLEGDSTSALAGWLAQPNSLERLDIADGVVNHHIAEKLFGAMVRGCSQLVHVNLSDNPKLFGSGTGGALGQWLSGTDKLCVLEMRGCGLDGNAPIFSTTMTALCSNMYLTELQLDLSGNPIGHAGALTLSPLLATAVGLVGLRLVDCQLGYDGVYVIVDGLSSSATLNELDLSMNVKGSPKPADVVPFANAWKRMFGSESLPLRELKFGGSSALKCEPLTMCNMVDCLAEVSHVRIPLKSLDVSGHGAGVKLASALARLIQVSPSLTHLYWDENQATGYGLSLVRHAMRFAPSVYACQVPIMDVALALKTAGTNAREIQDIRESIRGLETAGYQRAFRAGSNDAARQNLDPEQEGMADLQSELDARAVEESDSLRPKKMLKSQLMKSQASRLTMNFGNFVGKNASPGKKGGLGALTGPSMMPGGVQSRNLLVSPEREKLNKLRDQLKRLSRRPDAQDPSASDALADADDMDATISAIHNFASEAQDSCMDQLEKDLLKYAKDVLEPICEKHQKMVTDNVVGRVQNLKSLDGDQVRRLGMSLHMGTQAVDPDLVRDSMISIGKKLGGEASRGFHQVAEIASNFCFEKMTEQLVFLVEDVKTNVQPKAMSASVVATPRPVGEKEKEKDTAPAKGNALAAKGGAGMRFGGADGDSRPPSSRPPQPPSEKANENENEDSDDDSYEEVEVEVSASESEDEGDFDEEGDEEEEYYDEEDDAYDEEKEEEKDDGPPTSPPPKPVVASTPPAKKPPMVPSSATKPPTVPSKGTKPALSSSATSTPTSAAVTPVKFAPGAQPVVTPRGRGMRGRGMRARGRGLGVAARGSPAVRGAGVAARGSPSPAARGASPAARGAGPAPRRGALRGRGEALGLGKIVAAASPGRPGSMRGGADGPPSSAPPSRPGSRPGSNRPPVGAPPAAPSVGVAGGSVVVGASNALTPGVAPSKQDLKAAEKAAKSSAKKTIKGKPAKAAKPVKKVEKPKPKKTKKVMVKKKKGGAARGRANSSLPPPPSGDNSNLKAIEVKETTIDVSVNKTRVASPPIRAQGAKLKPKAAAKAGVGRTGRRLPTRRARQGAPAPPANAMGM